MATANGRQTKFSTISEQDWENIETPKPAAKESPWDEILEPVASGEIVGIQVQESELRGTRIALSRRASSQFGIKLEFKWDAKRHILAVRSLGAHENVPTGEKRGRGRPKKQA